MVGLGRLQGTVVTEPLSPKFCASCGSPVSGGCFCPNCGHEYDAASGAASAMSGSGARPALLAKPVAWGAIVTLVAGGLAIVGSFLPWITATAAFVGTISRSGIDGGGDGLLTIVLGIVVGLFGIARLARSGSDQVARAGTAICGLVLGETSREAARATVAWEANERRAIKHS